VASFNLNLGVYTVRTFADDAKVVGGVFIAFSCDLQKDDPLRV
jgi:hypothetical protein